MVDEKKLKDEQVKEVNGGVNAIYGVGAGAGIHFVSAEQGTESQTDNMWPFKATVQNVPASDLDGGEGRHPRK